MPDARLARTRASLPEDYQFGDAGIEDFQPPSPTLRAAARRYLVNLGLVAVETTGWPDAHRADTFDPPGYGHAV